MGNSPLTVILENVISPRGFFPSPLGEELMAKKICFELDDEGYERLIQFKRVFDVIMEEESDLQEYVATIVAVGLETMLKDIIPQDREVLWDTIRALNRRNPHIFADFLVDVLTRSEKKAEEVKKKVKGEALRYIT
ncbi:MAG: hypothetical protein DRN40_04720 [Thermoplasmata archaeon]|nr:MAG: hypothetical protein DRN40_04720 [Thermoplasmata archaeon]